MFQLFQRPTCPLLRDSSDIAILTIGMPAKQMNYGINTPEMDYSVFQTYLKIVMAIYGEHGAI